MIQFFLIAIYLFTLMSCSSASFRRENDSTPRDYQNDPEYPLAAAFDSLLRDGSELTAAIEMAKIHCKKTNPSPLCSPIKKIKTLKKLLTQKKAVYHPSVVKPLVPMIPAWKGNQITNWKALKKSPIPNLLKGLLPLNQEQLLQISKKSIDEKKCPNNIAIATAATLEDYLPNSDLFTVLAALYEKGGLCTKTSPVDRENFLTRAGIFYYLGNKLPEALVVLNKIRATDAYSGRAAYWTYRVKKAMADSEGVTKALNRLNSQHRFSFHNLVASHQENREPIPEFSRSLTFPTRSKKYKKFNDDIYSAEILSKFGFTESSHLLVDWLLTQPQILEADLRVYLAQLGDPHAKVMQMPGILMFNPELISKESITANFPEAYLSIFEKYKRRANTYLLLAIARRESSFNPKAVSPANAQGLLQMNPETVKVLFPNDSFNLLDPETNISIASRYLEKVLDEMGGDLSLTLSAYNAGEEQAKTWEKRYPREDKILWIDLIPFRETRDYVANVLSTYHWYRKIYENNSDFSDLLSR